jgi:hypothetical protein
MTTPALGLVFRVLCDPVHFRKERENGRGAGKLRLLFVFCCRDFVAGRVIELFVQQFNHILI